VADFTKACSESSDRSPDETPLLVFISAAEPSGDAHAAALIRAVQDRSPGTRFVGPAGPRMRDAGCRSIFDFTRRSAMLLGALAAVPRALAVVEKCDRLLRRFPFDAAVVVDSPALHFPIAARAQAAGIPVMYYIAPQLWAWGEYRLHKLRHRVDRLAVILPFEEKYFRDRGIDATYVGHPLAETFEALRLDADLITSLQVKSQRLVALLPGSRQHVVQEVLPGQLQVAERIAQSFPDVTFAVSVAGEQLWPTIAAMTPRCRVPIKLWPHRHHELIHAADLVLVASGTSTLEVAFHKKPMIVMYNASRLFYHLVGRWLIHTPHLSLPNILAGREIVPEFMPYFTSVKPIVECAIRLLKDEEERRRMVEALADVVTPLQTHKASERAAELLLELIHDRGH
jgi:lipid-A-disaccharide synthase